MDINLFNLINDLYNDANEGIVTYHGRVGFPSAMASCNTVNGLLCQVNTRVRFNLLEPIWRPYAYLSIFFDARNDKELRAMNIPRIYYNDYNINISGLERHKVLIEAVVANGHPRNKYDVLLETMEVTHAMENAI